MLNKSILMGRLTQDPELRYTQTDVPVTSFTIAVDRNYTKGEKVTDFIDIVAWRKTAEFISKYFTKGQMISLVGHLETSYWEDKAEKRRKETKVVVDEAYFADSKKETSPSTQPQAPQSDLPAAGFTEILGPNDDLPF